MVFKNRPVRDDMPLAHKFIYGNQMPAPKTAPSRMGQDGIHLAHYFACNKPVFQLSLRDNIINGAF